VCEAGCTADDAACNTRCATDYPLGVYIANRTPETLLIARTQVAATATFDDDVPAINRSVDLSVGPSRVVVGKIIDRNGSFATRVFAVCFDSHFIFGYDPQTGMVDTIIETGRGPHALAIDVDANADISSPANGYAALGYVGHFTDSYIGVVDLDQRHSTYGSIVLTLGRPTAPRAQK
jgi:hypothetical protein